MHPDVIPFISMSSRSAIFAGRLALLADIQHYKITYLIKHFHAQQDSEAFRKVEEELLTAIKRPDES